MAGRRRKRTGRVLGIDTGGTFTDLIVAPAPDSADSAAASATPDAVQTLKLPSTPEAPARALLDGLAQLGGTRRGDHVIHGTTVALNALLTGRVAPAALVTGRGFRDLIEVARQDRPDIYALHPRKPEPLIPRSLRFEVDQRSWPDPATGAIVEARAPTSDELAELAARIRRSRARSVAVCLLHSWAAPEIEERVGEALADLGLPVTLSGRVLAEHREYERFSTAAVNAVLAPLMRDYLAPLEERLGGARLSVLQSSGGTLPAAQAAREPVRVLLSGPAGGVVGGARAAREAGLGAIVTLDMGGTSTDVAFHAAAGDETEESAWRGRRAGEPIAVAGHPVGVPALDIHTIGCGGGSLVTVDAGGAMHVGPESAGADPGPVCYGRSRRPTVTDAHVLLGHIARGPFLGGALELDVEAVERAFRDLARRLGADPVRTARGVLDVARAGMRRALGVMTMQRGQDPRKLPLVAFGGAGGLHAAALAESLGMPCALVPHRPGLLSAWGMAGADALRDRTRTVLEPLSAWSAARRRAALRELGREGRDALAKDGHRARSVELAHSLDLRYRGQSFELSIPEGPDPAESFHRTHEAFFGYRLERPIELVCLRVRAAVRVRHPVPPAPRARPLPRSAIVGERRVVFDRPRRARVVARERLQPGHRFAGPALVEEYSGTTLVPPGWDARMTAGGHLLLERASPA